MNFGWSLFVIALVLINVIGVLWLLWWTTKRRTAASGGEEPPTTGHVWDEDLTELNNPLPRWWLWLFYLTILFAAVYLIFYPGFGNFVGALGWTQQGQHERNVAEANRQFNEKLARFEGLDLIALSRSADAMAMARNLFANNCTTCHGSDGRGAAGFPNLTDDDWLYGSDPPTVEHSITAGRNGVMPPLGATLGARGVEEVIGYVLQLGGQTIPDDWVGKGKTTFETVCAACHGADGRGNPLLGAPNLTDDVWLYDSSPQSIRQTLMQGRDNKMPPHGELLGPQKVRLLAAYVLSLSADERS